MTELLPCPKCGNLPAKLTECYDDEIRISYSCIMKSCMGEIVDKDKEAIERWTTRTAPVPDAGTRAYNLERLSCFIFDRLNGKITTTESHALAVDISGCEFLIEAAEQALATHNKGVG